MEPNIESLVPGKYLKYYRRSMCMSLYELSNETINKSMKELIRVLLIGIGWPVSPGGIGKDIKHLNEDRPPSVGLL